jgi:hypothetical protein
LVLKLGDFDNAPNKHIYKRFEAWNPDKQKRRSPLTILDIGKFENHEGSIDHSTESGNRSNESWDRYDKIKFCIRMIPAASQN